MTDGALVSILTLHRLTTLTSAGVDNCKEALRQAHGNLDDAQELLRVAGYRVPAARAAAKAS